MSNNPISELVSTAMQSLKQMIDVNTIVGAPVETSDGTVIIPISRVSFGFGAGGSEFGTKKDSQNGSFGGGSGGGVSINPVGFLVVSGGNVRLIPLGVAQTPVDKLIDYIPTAFEKLNEFVEKKKNSDE